MGFPTERMCPLPYPSSGTILCQAVTVTSLGWVKPYPSPNHLYPMLYHRIDLPYGMTKSFTDHQECTTVASTCTWAVAAQPLPRPPCSHLPPITTPSHSTSWRRSTTSVGPRTTRGPAWHPTCSM